MKIDLNPAILSTGTLTEQKQIGVRNSHNSFVFVVLSSGAHSEGYIRLGRWIVTVSSKQSLFAMSRLAKEGISVTALKDFLEVNRSKINGKQTWWVTENVIKETTKNRSYAEHLLNEQHDGVEKVFGTHSRGLVSLFR